MRVEPNPIRSFRDLRPGDCIVGFSRRILFQLKRAINEKLDEDYAKRPKNLRVKDDASSKHRRRVSRRLQDWLEDNPINNKCALIYGSLPPEVKKTQAKAFNEREEGIKYLVATNAIGMGLNLNINRVIFTNIYKNVRRKRVYLTPSEIMQIAGRAGRYQTDGYVSAFTTQTLNSVRRVLDTDQNHTNEFGGEYKEVVKQNNNEGPAEKVEVNIDELQDRDSEEEIEDFVAYGNNLIIIFR